MTPPHPTIPRLRQAVIAARDLEAAVSRLRREFGLGEPYRDPAVGYFGLANAVFAVGDTFLEVVSPIDVEQPGARTAARQLDRAGTAACGYMAMIQVADAAAARERARSRGVREVFAVELPDIVEAHLHPADMAGAIVAVSEPRPPDSWRWGGEGWRERAVPGALAGIAVGVGEPGAVAERWAAVAGGEIAGCRFTRDARSPGIVEISLADRAGSSRTLRPREW